MKPSEITLAIGQCDVRLGSPTAEVRWLLTDSRRLVQAEGTLFFAITTKRSSGTRYIESLYAQGVRSFVVPMGYVVNHADSNVWQVDDVVLALQRLAAWHRAQFHVPVIGITGSNGKTIVKDWLVQLLSPEGKLCASPKSYNSQIGVPLSVWQMDAEDKLAVFEAGISEVGEMRHLQSIIRPTIGLITNIGSAHSENFESIAQKVAEKLLLFTESDVVVYCSDHADIRRAIGETDWLQGKKLYCWGDDESADVRLLSMQEADEGTLLTVLPRGGSRFEVQIPFFDRASIENAMHCIAIMLLMGYDATTIATRCRLLAPVEMRLEMNEAIGGSVLINDSYSLDVNSLSIALDYMDHIRQCTEKTLIISDIMQSGVPDEELYAQVAHLVRMRHVHRMIAIGEAIGRCRSCFADIEASFYPSTEAFIDQCDPDSFAGQVVLLKGARVFAFERIAKLLQRKNHETVMEVNIDALIHNLNYHRARLAPNTKLMAMVKASSYGAGRVEVASALQYNHVDYLTVAYADEGVELRRGGITLPIMVMNPEEASFDDIIRYRLEPDIYGFRIMDLFARRVRLYGGRYPIHVEFDTGMHRLGFQGNDVPLLKQRLAELQDVFEVKSVFTHLACADDPAMDDFTHRQIARFRQWSDGLPGLKHILNSSGITRFPEAQLDMVRLGIGLYGVSPEPEVQAALRQVSRLVVRISQIKDIPQGDTVGYNCRWRAERPSRIAIITIGYADGLHRGLGYGNGRVLIGDKEAPIVGSVCMDMCFIDVTDVPCAEGDRVVMFGEGDLLQRNAAAAGTIPYELLTAVSPRVRRVYYHEG